MNINIKYLYLETNAVRFLCNKLELPFIKTKCFTSSLTVLELLTGLERDFRIRKKCVSEVLKHNIAIDWMFPDTIKAKAFSCYKDEDLRVKDLQKLFVLLPLTNSFDEYKERASKLYLEFDLNYFMEADRFYNKNFVKGSIDIIQEVPALLEREVEERTIPLDKQKLIIDTRADFFKLHGEHRVFNEGLTILTLCDHYADNDEEKAERIYNSYRGGISYYITAYSYYNILKISKGNISSENDRADLEHFLYLRNRPEIAIVSNDKLIRSICETFWPEKCINPAALLKV